MKFMLINTARQLDLVKEFDSIAALIHELTSNSFRYSAFNILDVDSVVVFRQEDDGEFYIVGQMDYHENRFCFSSIFARRFPEEV